MAEWHTVLKGHKTKPTTEPTVTIPSALNTEAALIAPLLTALAATDAVPILTCLNQNILAQPHSPLSELADEPTPTDTNDKSSKKIAKVLKPPKVPKTLKALTVARAKCSTHKK